MQRDSMANTFLVSTLLCVVCSLMVSSAAVALRPRQLENRQLDERKNIIAAAGLAENPGALTAPEVNAIFDTIQKKLIDLQSGEEVTDAAITTGFDPRQAAKGGDLSVKVDSRYDIGFPQRERYTWVYELRDSSGQLKQVVLPVYGKGLWSTLYGFVALQGDLATVQGLTFYQHGETPGLGGEVDNPSWKEQWVGKKVWEIGSDPADPGRYEQPRVGVAKGSPTGDAQNYMVDGLSGATITSRGVDDLLKFWFSNSGFGPYIQRLASESSPASDGGSQ
jgi:Na+-transporting NADH:ubiquinone oxidoreductase subunit C